MKKAIHIFSIVTCIIANITYYNSNEINVNNNFTLSFDDENIPELISL